MKNIWHNSTVGDNPTSFTSVWVHIINPALGEGYYSGFYNAKEDEWCIFGLNENGSIVVPIDNSINIHWTTISPDDIKI